MLKRLIDHVGLHDAGDLIALTTTEQMREILEESLWESLTPGRRTGCSPERFLEWLDVMLEAGAGFRDATPDRTRRHVRRAELRAADHGDRQRRCGGARGRRRLHAARCAVERSATLPFEVIGDYVVVGHSTTTSGTSVKSGARRTRRRRRASSCTAFWRAARRRRRCATSTATRITARRRDLRTGATSRTQRFRHAADGRRVPEDDAADIARRSRRANRLRRRSRNATSISSAAAAATAAEAKAREENEAAEPTTIRLRRPPHAGADCAPWRPRWPTREIIGDRQPQLLTGPKNAREPALELQARLDRLQMTRPDVFAARLGELIFLSNVLMAGSWYQGARFTEDRSRRRGARRARISA